MWVKLLFSRRVSTGNIFRGFPRILLHRLTPVWECIIRWVAACVLHQLTQWSLGTAGRFSVFVSRLTMKPRCWCLAWTLRDAQFPGGDDDGAAKKAHANSLSLLLFFIFFNAWGSKFGTTKFKYNGRYFGILKIRIIK